MKQVQTLCQTANTVNYCSLFEALYSISGLNSIEVWRQYFLNGLPKGLQQKIININTVYLDTCNKLYVYAKQLDS